MAKKNTGFLFTLRETLVNNGRVLTPLAAIAIIVGGIALVESPEKWWITLIAFASFFVIVFFFINARALVKSILAIGVTILLAGFAFTIGSAVEPLGSGAFVWFFGHLLVFSAALSVSYFIPSGQSRWTTIGLSVLLYFFLTWGLAILMNALLLPALLSILVSLGAFMLMYTFGSKSRFNEKKMPKAYESESLESNLSMAAEAAGLEFRAVRKKKEVSYVLWGERGYVLYPVDLQSGFHLTGKRNNVRLAYNDKDINPWLRQLSFTKIPYFKSRGADLMLVLLDVNGRNGSTGKTIGVTLPDSKAVTPVGVFPAKALKSKNEAEVKTALLKFDNTYKEYVDQLTEKQLESLSDFGASDDKKEEVESK